MRLIARSLVVVLLVSLFITLPAQAGLDWCKADPVVELNGTTVQIVVSIPETYVSLANGATRVEVETPRSVTRKLLYTDAGFNGHGEVVRFRNLTGDTSSLGGRDAFRTNILVKVPIDKSGLSHGQRVPVKVVVKPENGRQVVAYGNSDGTRVSIMVAGQR